MYILFTFSEIHALSLTSNKPLNINFVGELQELCMFNHWSLPNYQCSYNNTDLDNPYYSVICTLMNFKSEGKNNIIVQIRFHNNYKVRINIIYIYNY